MSMNGSGVFVVNSAGQPVVAETLITVAAFNAYTADVATALSTAIMKDGQTTVTANIPLATYKLTGVGDGTAKQDAATLANVVNGTGVYVATVGGTADEITLTPSPAITGYAAGQTFRFIASGANTTNVTVAISSLAAKAITKNGTTALVAGDIPSGQMVCVTYDGTRFVLSSLSTAQFLPITGGTLTGGLVGTTGNFSGLITAVGGQIAFPASQAASADANTLDDYEEGTWTPAGTFATPGDLSIAYSSRSGHYVKIGRLVTVWGFLNTSTFTHNTASGAFRVTGLPFTVSSSGTPAGGAGALIMRGYTKANFTQVVASPSTGNTYFGVSAGGSGQATAGLVVADMPSAGTVSLEFGFSYLADA